LASFIEKVALRTVAISVKVGKIQRRIAGSTQNSVGKFASCNTTKRYGLTLAVDYLHAIIAALTISLVE